MNIDIHTLAIVQSLTNIVQVVVLFIQYRLNKTHAGLGWWASGSAALALGFGFNYLRDAPIIGQTATIASIAMFVSGASLLYVGVLRFFGHREPRGWLIALCVLTTFIVIYFTVIDDRIAIRRLTVAVVLAAMSLFIARSLFIYRIRSLSTSISFLITLFLANAIFYGIRALETLLFGVPVDGAFRSTPTQAALYLMALIISTLWTFGLIMLVNQRLSEDSREAQEKSDTIFNTSPDAVLITRMSDGHFVAVNDGFTTLTGYSRAEVIEKSTLDVNIWKYSADRQRVVSALAETGSCKDLEMVFQLKDGSERIGMVTASLLTLHGEPHIISVTRDITRRKQIENELRASEEKFRYMTENSSDVIWHLDRNFCFTYISPAGERIRGFTQDEVIGTSVWSTLKPEGSEYVHQSNAQRIANEQHEVKGSSIRYELEQICKDGSWIWTETNITAHYDQSGELIGYHGVTREISDRKRLEKELEQRATTDELTGIANRRHFLELARNEIQRTLRLNRPLALALIDIDHFKQINDTYGHAVGDQALLVWTHFCQNNIRQIDVFARLGGDEFVLLFPETTCDHAYDTVNRICLALGSQPFTLSNRLIPMTISAGVAGLISADDTIDTLLERADRALYKAKEAGRNCVAVEHVASMNGSRMPE